jgi:hypothetical protein
MSHIHGSMLTAQTLAFLSHFPQVLRICLVQLFSAWTLAKQKKGFSKKKYFPVYQKTTPA